MEANSPAGVLEWDDFVSVPKIGTFEAKGCGDGKSEDAIEISELTSLGGGGTIPARGADGLDDNLDPTLNKKYEKNSKQFNTTFNLRMRNGAPK